MNNNCYIILYEALPNTDIVGLQTAIKAYGSWAKITETTWAVVTTQTAVQIRNNLNAYMANGRLFVVKSGIEAAWVNVICNYEWLKNNL